MAYIVTRMPSTGAITNVTHVDDPTTIVAERWADNPNVTVYEDDDFEAVDMGGDPPTVWQ